MRATRLGWEPGPGSLVHARAFHSAQLRPTAPPTLLRQSAAFRLRHCGYTDLTRRPACRRMLWELEPKADRDFSRSTILLPVSPLLPPPRVISTLFPPPPPLLAHYRYPSPWRPCSRLRITTTCLHTVVSGHKSAFSAFDRGPRGKDLPKASCALTHRPCVPVHGGAHEQHVDDVEQQRGQEAQHRPGGDQGDDGGDDGGGGGLGGNKKRKQHHLLVAY